MKKMNEEDIFKKLRKENQQIRKLEEENRQLRKLLREISERISEKSLELHKTTIDIMFKHNERITRLEQELKEHKKEYHTSAG